MGDPQAPVRHGTLRAGAAFLLGVGLLAAFPATSDTGRPDVRDGPAVETRRTVHLMGTLLEGTAWTATRSSGLRALEAAFGAIEREEELLSTWREDTGLARLNAAEAGTAVRVPARLHRRLEEAWALSRATDGAFDPAVGALVDAWDLRGEGRRPAGATLAAARRASGARCFELGADRRVTPRCPGAWIDAGAFGKGSGLRRARRALEAGGIEAALLDFGGQLLAVGAPPDREAWPAAVAHPARRDSPLVGLRLRDRSAATTSASERFVTIDGEARGHVLDPRTGRPAPAWGSVTVVAGDPLRADALSTALFVLGPAAGWRRVRGREDVGVLFLSLVRGERPADGRGARSAGGGSRDDMAGGGHEHDRTQRATAHVVACWNAAMERWLADVPVERRCPEDETRRES